MRLWAVGEAQPTKRIRLRGASFLSWAGKGFWAMLDQGLFSGANFFINILLARWLAPEEYGAFAVALSVFYFLAGFHTAVLTEPMMVFGAGKYREHFRKYLGLLLYGHLGLSILFTLLLGSAGLVLYLWGSRAIAQALVGLALALPFLLLLWLTRRSCYVPTRPRWAAYGSGVNLVVVLAGVFLLWRLGLLSALSSLVILGVAAGLSSMALALRLRPQLRALSGNPTPIKVLSDHWTYGSWNALGQLAYLASGQILMLLIPIFLGLAANAAVAAVWNLYRPISLILQSMGLVLLPVFSRWVSEGMSAHELRARTIRFAVLFGGVVALYGLAVTAVARPLLHVLYAGKYDEHWLLVGLFGLSTAASVVTGMFVLALKACGGAQPVAVIWGLSAGLVAVTAVPLMRVAALEGAISCAAAAYLVACGIAYIRLLREEGYRDDRAD